MIDKIAIPVAGMFKITFRFGEAPDWYVKIFGEPHNGVDLAVPVGTPVLACDNGRVSYADTVPDQNGCGLILSHAWGISLYWHLSKVIAKLGDVVLKGDLIGLSGATGYATGPHLHFGVKPNKAIDPNIRGWIDPEPYFEEKLPVQSPPPPVKRYHIVGFGETLWGLAQKYYGNGLEWKRIYDANKDKIKNPNLIYPFQKLLIP